MIDLDGSMNLTHVSAIDNCQFHYKAPTPTRTPAPAWTSTPASQDIFADVVYQMIAERGNARRTVVLLGVHLCGQLSPRLIELYHNSEARAMILSPCCIKAALEKPRPRPFLHEALIPP